MILNFITEITQSATWNIPKKRYTGEYDGCGCGKMFDRDLIIISSINCTDWYLIRNMVDCGPSTGWQYRPQEIFLCTSSSLRAGLRIIEQDFCVKCFLWMLQWNTVMSYSCYSMCRGQSLSAIDIVTILLETQCTVMYLF